MAKKVISLILICVVGLLLVPPLLVSAGCRRNVTQPTSLEMAQDIFQKTSWRHTHFKWNPSLIPGFLSPDTNGSQILLLSSNTETPVRIIYSESEPISGLFSSRGSGTLLSRPDLQPPLFQLESGYTKDKPETIILIGIVKNRMFWVEADGDNKDTVFSNACQVATDALKQLGRISIK